MNVWLEMMTALRGGIDELGETMKASQAVEILDIKIRQTEQALQEYKQKLATTLVKKKTASQQVEELDTQVAKYEGYAIKALEQQDETLALEVSEEIAILENALVKQRISVTASTSMCENLRFNIRSNEQEIQRLTQQKDTIKATANVNQAQQATFIRTVNADGESIKIQTAKDVLAKLKAKQKAVDTAKQTGSLKSRLLKAGIIDEGEEADATALLENIK